MTDWRTRLREAVRRSGRKQAAVARDAGIAPETLSRILNVSSSRPRFETITRIAHASGETIGWVLDERGYQLSTSQLRRLREAAQILEEATKERT